MSNKIDYKGFEEWIKSLNKSNKEIVISDENSVAELKKYGFTFTDSNKWSNNKNDAAAKRYLKAGYIVSFDKNNGKLTFTYDESRSKDVLNGNNMIILNNMYTGRYISSWGNLGHEAINLIRADAKTDEDKGKFYIWLNSMGICLEPIDNDTGCTVLMVRSINSTKYKVIAKAEGCRLCPGANISRSQNNHETDYDDKKIRHGLQQELNVKYNNKCPIDDIYNEKDMFATFCADEVLETNCDVYLITKDSDEKEDENNHIYSADFKIGETMRAYIDASHKANESLKAVIDNEDLWVKIEDSDVANIQNPEFNFFKLIRKDKDELTLSNALAYFIDKVDIESFLKDCLELAIEFANDKYKLFREKNNIDISFFGEKNVVIIENKIDAGITANTNSTISGQINSAAKLYYDKSKYDTENDYKDTIKGIIEKTGEFNDETKASQLSKYYIYAVAYLLNKDGIDADNIQEHINCFLLIPEYAKKDFNPADEGYYNSVFYLSEKYKIITYKKILKFFNDKKAQISDKYISDFISALKPLANEFNNELEAEMKYRFFKAIGKITD